MAVHVKHRAADTPQKRSKKGGGRKPKRRGRVAELSGGCSILRPGKNQKGPGDNMVQSFSAFSKKDVGSLRCGHVEKRDKSGNGRAAAMQSLQAPDRVQRDERRSWPFPKWQTEEPQNPHRAPEEFKMASTSRAGYNLV